MTPESTLDTRKLLLVVIVVELLYLVATRLVIHRYSAVSIEGELIRTLLRLASAAVYWTLLKPVILSRRPRRSHLRQPTLLAGVLLFLLFPAFEQHYSYPYLTGLVFAATSLVVGIKEEILFRAIGQNLLMDKLKHRSAILITSAIFTAWHIGAIDPSWQNFVGIFFASVLLGVIYARSGSLAFVILLHAGYDALFALPSPLAAPIGGWVPLLVMLPMAIVLVSVAPSSVRRR